VAHAVVECVLATLPVVLVAFLTFVAVMHEQHVHVDADL